MALAFLVSALITVTFTYAPRAHQTLWFVVVSLAVLFIDVLLVICTARLKPVLPTNSAHVA